MYITVTMFSVHKTTPVTSNLQNVKRKFGTFYF